MNGKAKMTAAIVLALGIATGVLIQQASRPPYRSALQPHDSGFAEKTQMVTGPISINYISNVTLSRSGSRFTYWTGAMARGKRPITPPTTVVATAEQGLVRVEVKAEAQAPGHSGLADAVARQINAATRQFWPGEQVPVAVELHQVPPDSRFEFARHISWREGKPFHLTLFIHESLPASDQAGTAVHELYHVLASRWRLGAKSGRSAASPWLGTLYEEVAATLLADCSQLQLTGRLPLPEPEGNYTLEWGEDDKSIYSTSLDTRGMAWLLDPERAAEFKFTAGFFNNLLRGSALIALEPEDGVFMAGSDSARELIALCHAAVADPWYLEGWFAKLIAADPAP